VDGGTVNGVTAASGATIVVNDGGVLNILSGDTAFGVTVNNGGYVDVKTGGAIDSATIAGGTLEIATGGLTGSAAVTFAGGGDLILDDAIDFDGLVAGFKKPDSIDLVDIPFNKSKTMDKWKQHGASGTLTVTEGGHVADVTLLGNYATADFHLENDGVGGTLVTDPPPLGSSLTLHSPHG
jgi:autotransporter passenger strand-loop-strand repeat protein